jgi:hypothetical protein
MGSLLVAADPSDANVRLLNSEEAYSRDMGLPQGRYFIEVSKEGYLPQDLEVSIRAGEKNTVSLRLEKRPEPPTVSSAPGKTEPPSSPSADTASGTPEPNKMRTDVQVAAQVLLGQAEQAYLEGRITVPPGNNTIQYYKQAFALDRENGGIYASLLHAAGESVTRAKTSIARKDFRSARSLVSQAENILQAVPNPPLAQYQPAFQKLAAEIVTLSKMPADSVDGKAPSKPDAVAVKQEAPVQPKLLKEDFPSGKILKEDFRSTNPTNP